MTQYATAQEILDAANAELGLPQVAFGASSTDQTGRQAAALMTAIGNDLVRLHDWQFLLYEATFTGNGTQTRFPLPTDFGRVVNQTMWSTQGLDYPVIGPESPQVWGWLKYGAYGGGVYYRYRIVGNEIEVFPAPGNGQQFSFAYITKNWAYANNANKTPKDVVNAGDDTPIFNARLMISGLKARLWG
jgi:hypothetical protein